MPINTYSSISRCPLQSSGKKVTTASNGGIGNCHSLPVPSAKEPSDGKFQHPHGRPCPDIGRRHCRKRQSVAATKPLGPSRRGILLSPHPRPTTKLVQRDGSDRQTVRWPNGRPWRAPNRNSNWKDFHHLTRSQVVDRHLPASPCQFLRAARRLVESSSRPRLGLQESVHGRRFGERVRS